MKVEIKDVFRDELEGFLQRVSRILIESGVKKNIVEKAVNDALYAYSVEGRATIDAYDALWIC